MTAETRVQIVSCTTISAGRVHMNAVQTFSHNAHVGLHAGSNDFGLAYKVKQVGTFTDTQ